MQRLLITLSLLMPYIAFAQESKYNVNAIAFYNLENLFDTIDDPNKADEEFTPNGSYSYTKEVYKEKLHNIATVIQKLGTEYVPDGVAFMGVAEVENSTVLTDLVNQHEIKNRHYQQVCFYGPDARGINTGFLYNPKYFTLISARAYPVDLAEAGSDDKTRDVLFVTGTMGSDTVYVMITHWPSRYGGEAASAPKRAIAAKVNKHITDSLLEANPSSKIFIMGDLNDDPTNASVAEILKATGKQNKAATAHLYNPWVQYYKKGIGTLGYRDVWNLFDQIIVSDGLLTDKIGWKYYKSEVFNKNFLLEKYGPYKGYPKRSFVNGSWNHGYSDHLPVVIYLIKPVILN